MSSISNALSPLPQQFKIVETKTAQTTAPASIQIAAANPLRWAILFGPPFDPTAGSYLNGFVAPSSSPSGGVRYGFPVNLNYGLQLNFRDFGILVQQAWFGHILSGVTPIDWYVTEVLIQQ